MLVADAAADDNVDWHLFGSLVSSVWAGEYRADGEQMVP
jgi:hypothetical protein